MLAPAVACVAIRLQVQADCDHSKVAVMFNFWKLSLVKRGIIILGGSCLRHLRHSRDLCSRASSDYHVYKIRKAAQKDVPIILKFITVS